jgi:hypothetical protein
MTEQQRHSKRVVGRGRQSTIPSLRPTATPRRLTLAMMMDKPMDEWSVEEWVAFMQEKTELE